MSMYTPSKAVLEFRFAGEKGLGAGVTASFYSAVAAELQRRSVNAKVGDVRPPYVLHRAVWPSSLFVGI